jgi:hypothetical protein
VIALCLGITGEEGERVAGRHPDGVGERPRDGLLDLRIVSSAGEERGPVDGVGAPAFGGKRLLVCHRLDVVESEPVYEYTESQGERVREELAGIFDGLSIDATVSGVSSLFITHFAPAGPIETVRDVELRTDRDALRTFHRRLLERGYYFLPAHMGAISYQTTEAQLDGLLEDIERDAIISALEQTRYNKTAAAKLLGMSFRALRYRIKKLEIE